MKRVKVTFFIEGDDPEHETGVTEDTYNRINDKLLDLGAEDVSMVAMHEGDDLEEENQ